MSTLKLRAFEYFEPAGVAEAVALLDEHGDAARVLAGGVDLIPRMRSGGIFPECLVNIQRISDLDYIREPATGGLEFGAMASLHSLERSAVLKGGYPALHDAIRQITSVQTKYMGTAVGNICVATPASDLAPALAAYDAELLVVGPGGERNLPVVVFYPAYQQTALRRGELVRAVWLPPTPPALGACFTNLVRTHGDIAKVTVTAAVALRAGACAQARIALGSVAPTLLRAREAEALLEGKEPTAEVIARAAAMAAESVQPVNDVRSTAEYRRSTTEVLVARALTKAAERARAAAMRSGADGEAPGSEPPAGVGEGEAR
jgi:aerobic carbon-monoxide dehydrogenase medium subunit